MARARVLIAEDHEAMRDVIVSALSADFDVIGAVGDGGAAIAAAARLLPDVAVLDVSMPVLDGIAVARRLRETSKATKVVFLTANEDLDASDVASETGSLGYVLKSCMDSDLIPAIKLAVDGYCFVSPALNETARQCPR